MSDSTQYQLRGFSGICSILCDFVLPKTGVLFVFQLTSR